MNTKHTPGPWSVEADMNTFVIRGAPVLQTSERDIKFEFCDFIASTWGGQTKKNEANAHLIAAAPELLEALRPFAAFKIHHAPKGISATAWADYLRNASAAIAKATGSEA